VFELSKSSNHASRKKKVYEVEQELRGLGYFTFHRGNTHGLFHVIAFHPTHCLFVQVGRLHKYNQQDINKELVKAQKFILDGLAPYAKVEVWVWVNNRGWLKFRFDDEGNYTKFDDYGTHHFRMANQYDPDEKRKPRRKRKSF
jgi:hypothetical protein